MVKGNHPRHQRTGDGNAAGQFEEVKQFRPGTARAAAHLYHNPLRLQYRLCGKGIGAVIRRGARHRRFVAAAFVIGLLIAVIELPCTGQAYLPTLAYMVRDDALRLNALFHLLLYNVLFILPLAAVFLFAAFGLTHERLAAALRAHAAAVKFATAALFFVLFAVFLFAG